MKTPALLLAVALGKIGASGHGNSHGKSNIDTRDGGNGSGHDKGRNK